MNSTDELYIRLFLIVPLLIYTGYSIRQNKSHTSSVLFHVIVVSTIILVLFFHIRYLVKVVRRIFLNQKYQKEFGEFLLLLALFIIVLCVYDINHHKKPH